MTLPLTENHSSNDGGLVRIQFDGVYDIATCGGQHGFAFDRNAAGSYTVLAQLVRGGKQ
jgi:hypothetical protein